MTLRVCVVFDVLDLFALAVKLCAVQASFLFFCFLGGWGGG